MKLTMNRFTLEIEALGAFFIRAFGYEVFKQPEEKAIICKEVTSVTSGRL